MDEKEYIFKNLKYLIEENHRQNGIIDSLITHQEELLDTLTKLAEMVNKLSDPDYIRKVNQFNAQKEMEAKIEFLRSNVKSK